MPIGGIALVTLILMGFDPSHISMRRGLSMAKSHAATGVSLGLRGGHREALQGEVLYQ